MDHAPLFVDGWYSTDELQAIRLADGAMPMLPDNSAEVRADRATAARLVLDLVARVGGVAAHVEDGVFDLVRLR